FLLLILQPAEQLAFWQSGLCPWPAAAGIGLSGSGIQMASRNSLRLGYAAGALVQLLCAGAALCCAQSRLCCAQSRLCCARSRLCCARSRLCCAARGPEPCAQRNTNSRPRSRSRPTLARNNEGAGLTTKSASPQAHAEYNSG